MIGVAIVPLIALAGTSAASAKTHPAATPACGFSCSNLFSEQLGTGTIQAVFVPGSNGQAIKAKAGSKVDLKMGNDSYTNEDFILSEDDTLGDACQPVGVGGGSGLLSPSSFSCIQLRTGHFSASSPVIESNWAPSGNESGLCPGVTTAGVAGESVTLQPCGLGANTLWVIDTNDAHVIHGIPYAPAVLGSDGNTSMPLVLQVNTGSKGPQNQLRVERLALLSHGFVPNQDEWSLFNGPAL